MPLTGLFEGCFGFSPSKSMFLCLSLEICKLPSYSQTGSAAAAWSVPTSFIVPWEVLVPPTGSFGGCFQFSPSNAMFLSISLDLWKLSSYSPTGRPAAARSVPKSYIGPVGVVGATHGAVRGLFWVFTL